MVVSKLKVVNWMTELFRLVLEEIAYCTSPPDRTKELTVVFICWEVDYTLVMP